MNKLGRLTPLYILAVALLFQFSSTPSAGSLPGKIPALWADRLVELEGASGKYRIYVCGVMVAPKTVLTCCHWDGALEEGGEPYKWTAIFRTGLTEVQRITVGEKTAIEGFDLALFELKESPKILLVTPIAKAEPENGTFVAILGSPWDYTHFWTFGIYSGQHIQGPPDAYAAPLALVGAPVGPGNSGGPVLDPDGRLVGVVSCGRSDQFPAALVTPVPAIIKALDNAHISH